MTEKAAVLGAGSWGTALAVHLGRRGPVALWARAADDPERIAEHGENRRYLPGVPLSPGVTVTGEVARALDGAGVVVLAVPTQFVRGFLAEHRAAGSWQPPIAIAAKGIEVGTLALPSAIVGQVLGEDAAARSVAFSGPSFAREVVAGEPTAVVAACADARQAERVQQLFSHDNLRVYTSPDAVGVQLAGALKNVVAIAAGVLDGLGNGSNALAALITRGNAEISRLGVAMGARRDTFMGLAGMGDLVLTCTGTPLAQSPARARAGAGPVACGNRRRDEHGGGRGRDDPRRGDAGAQPGDRDADRRPGPRDPLRGDGTAPGAGGTAGAPAEGRDRGSPPVIDTHCHLLPGLDDGAPDDAVALAMARLAVADGVTAIVATPHMREGDYLNERPTVIEAVEHFRELLAREAVPLAIEPGSEVHLSARLVERIVERRILAYGDRQPEAGRPAYLLLECPYRNRPIRLEETVFELLLGGIVPVIAHPERIRWFQEDPTRYEALVTRGVLGQMTTSSLLGTFGKSVQTLAESFVRRGLVHLLASDAHDTEYRPPLLAEGRRRWAELAGEASAESATAGIPRALVEGRAIEVAPPRAEPRPRGLWERLLGGR